MRKSGSPACTAAGVSALRGATLIITRPVGAARTMQRRIEALGGSVLKLPGIALRPPLDLSVARRALATTRLADTVIFSSPAAASYAFRLNPRLRFARASQIVAVGAGTARALARRGLPRALVPAHADSEGVLGMPELASVRGRSIAVIGAPGGRELLPLSLRRRGARVSEIQVYRRAPPRLDRRHLGALEQALPPLILLLSSGQALANLLRMLPLHLVTRLLDGDLVASSARIAAQARSAGFTRVHRADSAAPAALVEAACAVLARHRL